MIAQREKGGSLYHEGAFLCDVRLLFRCFMSSYLFLAAVLCCSIHTAAKIVHYTSSEEQKQADLEQYSVFIVQMSFGEYNRLIISDPESVRRGIKLSGRAEGRRQSSVGLWLVRPHL